jgi:hypothetical protein
VKISLNKFVPCRGRSSLWFERVKRLFLWLKGVDVGVGRAFLKHALIIFLNINLKKVKGEGKGSEKRARRDIIGEVSTWRGIFSYLYKYLYNYLYNYFYKYLYNGSTFLMNRPSLRLRSHPRHRSSLISLRSEYAFL